MVKVITQFHDNSASIIKFKSYFNGDTKDTIRFIFAIERYNTISRFQNPNSLFNQIYNNLSDPIKTRFAADKLKVIREQRAMLSEDSTTEQIAQAEIYSVNSMQTFFMTHYRPSITRGKIFRNLLSIRMRYNENPIEVLDRVVQAIRNARKTIELYNAANIGIAMPKILMADRTHILTNVFCTKNNCQHEKNQGGINKLVQKAVREKELQYENHAMAYTAWYSEFRGICAKIGGVHYSGDDKYKYVYHQPQILELWDKPRKTKPKTPTRKPKNPLKRKLLQPQTPNQPKPKRPRYDPSKSQRGSSNTSNTNPSSLKCFRCGRYGHHCNDCYSTTDINHQRLRRGDRRQMRDMPFRGDYKPPKANPNIQQSPSNNPQQPRGNPKSYTTRNYRQGNPQNNKNPWRQYGSNPNQQQQSNPTRNETPQRRNHNHNQPQINALLAQIQSDVEADPHSKQNLITNLRNLASMMPTDLDPDTTDTGHHPR